MPSQPTTDATPLRLVDIRPGQPQTLRLRLMELRRNDKRPTDFFLDLSVDCLKPALTYLAQARPDFGATPPERAALTIIAGRNSAEPPIPLVRNRVPVDAQFVIAFEAATEWLTLWISSDGEPAVPAQLAGEVRLRHPQDERPAEALPTARLPSLKFVMRQSLMYSFRLSSSPALVTLGEIMRGEEPRGKYELLRRLVDSGADVRLDEAGVRDFQAAEQIVEGFPPVDFARLSPEQILDAAVIVLHPGAPLPLVLQTLGVAFGRQFTSGTPQEGERWRGLVKAAAVVICRKDRSLLTKVSRWPAGWPPTRRGRRCSAAGRVGWTRSTPSLRPLNGPVEAFLRRVTGRMRRMRSRRRSRCWRTTTWCR